jgi:hypothetical protein
MERRDEVSIALGVLFIVFGVVGLGLLLANAGVDATNAHKVFFQTVLGSCMLGCVVVGMAVAVGTLARVLDRDGPSYEGYVMYNS